MLLPPSFAFPFAKTWHNPDGDKELRMPILLSVTENVNAFVESHTSEYPHLIDKVIRFHALCERFIYESSLSKDEYTNRKTLPLKIVAFLHNKRRILPKIDEDAVLALSTDMFASMDVWQLVAFYHHVKLSSMDEGPFGDKAFHYFILLHSKITTNQAYNESQRLAFEHLVKCDNPFCVFDYPTQVSYRIYVCLMSLQRENTTYTDDMCRDMIETLMAFVYNMMCDRNESKYKWYFSLFFTQARIYKRYTQNAENLKYKESMKRTRNQTCSICLNDINTESYQMPGCCNHGFCTDCLKEWTRRHRMGFRCPMCNRSSMTIKDVEKNQLTIKFVA